MDFELLTEKIIGCAYHVYNHMGFGFLESVYEKCMMIELARSGLHAEAQKPIEATYEGVVVGDFIADIVVERMGLKNVVYEFTGGARGWKADVPVYRLATEKVRARGWSNRRNSREAVVASVDAMIEDLKKGNLKPAD